LDVLRSKAQEIIGFVEKEKKNRKKAPPIYIRGLAWLIGEALKNGRPTI